MITSSLRQVVEVPGSRFRSGVEHAGDAAEQRAEKFKLPDATFAFLGSLPRAKDPADQAELKVLLSERFALNEKTLRYAEARIAEWRADTETAHEVAKRAVREQGAVLDKLKEKLASDQQEVIRAQNLLTKAQREEADAVQALRGLSRFAAKKEIAEAEKRVELATKNMRVAETKAAELGQCLNSLKLVTVPEAQKKMAALMERELDLCELLAGRDPDMTKSGILR